jgi:hypothetical protein
MDATPRIEPAGPIVATPAVVAVVRPLDPNVAVLRAAAERALATGSQLLVLGTLEPMIADWVDGIDVAGPTLQAAHSELFCTCVEQLYDQPVQWGVHVQWGRLAPEVLRLAEQVPVVAVLRGQRRRDSFLRRTRRRITGRIDRLLGSLDVQAV